MKYYEVRKNNNKVWLREAEVLYDGDFDLLKYCIHDVDEFYKIEFRGMRNSITNEKLLKAGFICNSHQLKWVLTDSDHRKDVRLVNESFYIQLKEGLTDYNISYSCENIFSEHPYSFKPMRVKATKAYHKLGDISREIPDVAIVFEADDDNYYGYWEEGYDYIDVRFPKETSIII